MKLAPLVFISFCSFFNSIQSSAQVMKVDLSKGCNREIFLNDDCVKDLVKQYNNFISPTNFEERYKDELILVMKTSVRKTTLFIIKWDKLKLDCYFESIEGSNPSWHNKVKSYDSSSQVHKKFIQLAEINYNGFFTQRTSIKEKYYTTEFLFISRSNTIANWGVYSLNGREFKSDINYPSLEIKNLLDFILIELGG